MPAPGPPSPQSTHVISGTYEWFTPWACRAWGTLLTVSATRRAEVPLADIGELVKLGDGRWARYQQCAVDGPAGGLSILVAVELDERTQRLLDAAELGATLEPEDARASPRLELADVGMSSEVVAAVH